MNVQIADRLVYSTLTARSLPGYDVDMIRGDLPIPKGGQYSAPAGTAADTLEAGAFAAMFGLEARTAQQTTALILADQAGTRPTLGGADISELTLCKRKPERVHWDRVHHSLAQRLHNCGADHVLDERRGLRQRDEGSDRCELGSMVQPRCSLDLLQ